MLTLTSTPTINSGIKYRILEKPYSLFPIPGVAIDGPHQIGKIMKGRRVLRGLIVLQLGLNHKKPMYKGHFSVFGLDSHFWQ